MRWKLIILGLFVFFGGGCDKHPLTDFRTLDQAGMNSSVVENLKSLNVSDGEVAQLVKLKQAGLSDDACLALVGAARERKHLFSSADAAVNLASASYTEPQILEIARADQLDSISGEAVTLRLIGLSDATVQMLLRRHLHGEATLSSGQISRLKNTGLTEKQIVERITQGMSDEQAAREITARETVRNHAGTGFVRVHGRKSR